MVRFIFEAGLPYLGLRTAIRSNNSHIINDMYIYMIDIFRATKKRLYAKLRVFNLHTLHILKPQLRSIWERYRTASLRGKNGRNVGWDFTLERMNLEVSELIGSNINPEFIQECIRLLNGIRHIRGPALESLFGNDDMDVNENDRILESDVAAAVHFLKEALGFDGNDDFSKLVAAKPNVFRTDGSVAPWTRIQEINAAESLHDYVVRTLHRAPKTTFA